jgi:hypothetical protein
MGETVHLSGKCDKQKMVGGAPNAAGIRKWKKERSTMRSGTEAW